MLFLTLLFVSSAVATPLLGTEQCARGPPYWCQNVKTASRCGAVAHCQHNVWKQPQMKSVPCDLCKEVVIVVAQILKQNSTETEVLEYLEKACALIPDEGLAAECKEMLDDYYPIVIGIIIGELEDPGVVCGAIGLCRSQQAALAQVQAQAQAQEQLVSNEIPQVDLSRRASPFLLNVPQLLFPQESPKQEAPKQEAPKQEAPKQEDDVCKDCVKFLADVQTEGRKNASFLSFLIENFEHQCDQLGPSLSSLCKEYVSQYAALILEQFMTMDPKEFCALTGFCPAKKSAAMLTLLPAKSLPAAKLFPAAKVDSAADKPAQPVVRVRESNLCAICEFVMEKLETMLQSNATEEEVIHAVEKICTFAPTHLQAQCKDLIETYGQAIIELLVQEADPKTVCTVLSLCNDARRLYVSALDQTRFKVGGYCEVCKMAIKYLDVILEKNSTKEQIEEALKRVCSFLSPAAVQTECDQLVEQYEPELAQLIYEMLDPDFVCMKLRACPDETDNCALGPEFWCKNMEAAKLCDAVPHCRRHVWV